MLSNAENFPLLAEEEWTLQLIEAGAPGAKREPDRAKPQLMVSWAKLFRPKHFAELTTITASRCRARASRPSAASSVASRLLLMPQPPLLCEEGNIPNSTSRQFIHTFYRPYNWITLLLVLVFFFWRLDLNLRFGENLLIQFRKLECADRHDALSARESFADLHIGAIANAQRDGFPAGFILRIDNHYRGVSGRTCQHRILRNDQCARDGFSNHLSAHAGARF